MRIFAALPALSILLQIGAASASLPSSADILYWPVGSSSQPSLLAKVEYDSKTLETNVLSYTPPTAADSNNGQQDLVRVGFFIDTPASSKQWVGSLISQSALTTQQRQKLHLYLGATEQPYHVSLSPHFNQSTDALDVDLVFSKPGPQPELNKPVVINPDGTNSDEVVEKTLFQK